MFRRMPAKPSTTASISLHPRDGITPETVGKLEKWVGKQKNIVCAVACSEPNANGSGRHLHIAIGFSQPVKVSDDYKDRLRTCLSEELSDPENWGRPSIVCKAHHDLAGLIGGYYDKDIEHKIEWTIGTPPTPDELAQGAVRRDNAIINKRKATVSKSQIPTLFRDYHLKMMSDEEEINAIYGGLPDGEIAYSKLNPEEQVDYCYRGLIRNGYRKIIMELSCAKLSHLVKYWADLISPEEV